MTAAALHLRKIGWCALSFDQECLYSNTRSSHYEPPVVEPDRSATEINFAVIGHTQVGKSALIEHFCINETLLNEDEALTRFHIDARHRQIIFHEVNLENVGLAPDGCVSWPNVSPTSIDGAFILYDVCRKSSFSGVPEILDALQRAKLQTTLLASKCDIHTNDRVIDPSDVRERCKRAYGDLQCAEISRETPRANRELLIEVVRCALTRRYAQRDKSDTPHPAPFAVEKTTPNVGRVETQATSVLSGRTVLFDQSANTSPESANTSNLSTLKNQASCSTMSRNISFAGSASVKVDHTSMICSQAVDLSQILDHIASPGTVQQSSHGLFTSSFSQRCIVLHPLFTDSRELLATILDRTEKVQEVSYQTAESASHLAGLRNALHYWQEIAPTEVASHRAQDQLQHCVARRKDSAVSLDSTRHNDRSGLHTAKSSAINQSPRPWDADASSSVSVPSVYQVDVTEAPLNDLLAAPMDIVAQSIVSFEAKAFARLSPRVMIAHALKSSFPNTFTAELLYVLDLASHLRDWTATMILFSDSAARRARIIARFILIAKQIRALNDYNALAAILSGLNSTAIRRLEASWTLVDAETTQIHTQLSALMSYTSSFAAYRLALESTSGPLIPFLLVTFRDLISADAKIKIFVERDGRRLINKRKLDILGEILDAAQAVPYSASDLCEANEQTRKMICNVKVLQDENAMYGRSIHVEPIHSAPSPASSHHRLRRKFSLFGHAT